MSPEQKLAAMALYVADVEQALRDVCDKHRRAEEKLAEVREYLRKERANGEQTMELEFIVGES